LISFTADSYILEVSEVVQKLRRLMGALGRRDWDIGEAPIHTANERYLDLSNL
jgi:hypothetical protein